MDGSPAMESILDVRSLSVAYRLQSGQRFAAVRDVSFAIAAGETLGLMGESGCGKTSIAQAVMGLLPRKVAEVTGTARFRGVDVIALRERELQKLRGAQISIVYQEPEIALSPFLRAGVQVAEVIRVHRRLSWKECRTEAQTMLARMGLKDPRIFSAYPHQLSGGQRQRVVLAQALACNPSLLIADEPTAHLDAQSQSDFLALLEGLKRESKIAILLISHAPEIQARLSDRLLLMQGGRIVEQGRIAGLLHESSRDYTRAILGSPAKQSAYPNVATEERVLG